MTNEEAKKMLKAKLECLKNETSGINYDCNMRLCDGCSLNYEQGNMGEQKEALEMAIKALEAKTGHWSDECECSVCGNQPWYEGSTFRKDYKFCPYCGANMRGDEE